jgi:2-polyprenyl-6-methoxyphenol hydroxylase-like FAD-dependent oxidoreductase
LKYGPGELYYGVSGLNMFLTVTHKDQACMPPFGGTETKCSGALPKRCLTFILREAQLTWCISLGGRVVQLGDAAHIFLSTSGNGGTQAMEDIMSLAACLDIAGREQVLWATRVYNLL